MNTADAEEMAQPLEQHGLVRTAEMADADVAIMNTCTVREQAAHRAESNIGRLREWKAENPERILIVAGCAATLWGEGIRKRFPYIDAVSPATKIEEFPELIKNVMQERWNGRLEESALFQESPHPASGHLLPVPGPGEGTPDNFLFGSENTAYVTIMRGCNYSCAYCIVPQVRGREKYRALPEILSDIRRFAAEGNREVMLLGQTVNSYYYRSTEGERENIIDFSDLLREVAAIPEVERIRFMSPHPRHMRDKLIQTMSELPKMARHVHLPLQSGSTAMLQRMNRLYTRDQYLSIIQKLRAAIPGLLITTDIIIGFPGETDDEFNDTITLMEEVRFDGVFGFSYSPRPGTVSAERSDDVPENVKELRLQQVLALNQRILQERDAARAAAHR